MPRLFWLALIVCLILPAATIAQDQPPPEPTEKEQETEKQALEMLNAIAGSIPNLRSYDNRIYVEGAVADMLWTRDEKRARSYYEMLSREVAQVMATIDPADQRASQTLGNLQQLRRELIERISRRDPESALSFLRNTRPPAELRLRANDYDNEANIEIHLAGLLASKDPERALQLGRASLKKGVTFSLTSMLQQMATKSPDAARAFHSEMVERLKTTDLSSNHDAANAAWNLLGSFQPPQANEETYRALIQVLSSSMLGLKPDARSTNSTVQIFSGQLIGYLPQFEKYAPERVAALKQWSEQTKKTMDPGSSMYQDLNEVSQRGTVDDILALTSKYGADFHNQIYQSAVYKALSGGDQSRARQIINERIKDPNQRRQMLDQLESQLFWSSANENKIAEARQYIDRVKNTEQRFQLLIQLAHNLINRNDKKEAANILAEAVRMADTLPVNANTLSTKLQLAQAYSVVEPAQSVVLLQSAVTLSNQLVAAATVLDGFENTYLRDGEWMKRGYSSLSNMVNNIQQSLGQLARVDADDAKTLADQIERPEIRIMAQLEIAKTLLAPKDQRQNFNRILTAYPNRRK